MSKTAEDTSFAKIDELNKQAWELNRKDPVKAIQLSEQALQESLKNNYKYGQAQALKTLGASNVWISKNEDALKCSFEAIELFTQLNDKKNEAETYYNIGANFRYISDFDSAIRFYNKCYEVSKEIGNEVGMADGLNGLGSVYYNMNENHKALEVLLESQRLCIKHNCEDIYIKVLDGIGEAYYNLGEPEKALDYYIKCAELSKKLGNKQVEAFALDGLGRTYAALNKNKEAEKYFDLSLAIRKEIGFKPGQVISLLNKGNYLLEQKNVEESIKLIQESLNLAASINSKEGVYKACEKISLAYERIGDYENAYKYYKKYASTRDEVITENTAQLIRSIEMQQRMMQSQAEKQSLEARAKELETYSQNLVLLGEIGQKIISQIQVANIVKTVYDNVNQLMDATGFGVGLFDKEKNQISFPLFIEGGEPFENIRYDLSDKNRLSTLCFTQNREIIINDVESEIKQYVSVNLAPTFGKASRSVIYLPLLVKGKTVGVITVQSFSKNAYNAYHLNILRNLASYTAIALENAALYEEQEKTILERTHEAIEKKQEVEAAYQNNKKLSELGQQITASVNFEEIFEKLHKYVSSLMDCGAFGVRLYDPVKNTIDYKYGIDKGIVQPSVEVSMNDKDNFSVWCVSNRKEIFINDIKNDYKKYTNSIIVVTGDMPHSLLFCPVIINEKVLGCITVQSYEKNAYTDYHLDILKTLATYTAIALENANLFEIMEQKVQERTKEVVKQKEEIEKTYNNARLLSQIGNDITSLLSVKDIIEKVYDNVNGLMDAAGFGIGVYKPESEQISFPLYIEDDEKFHNIVYHLSEKDKLASICFNSRKEIVINDFLNEIASYVGYVQAPLQGKVVNSIIYMPLLLKDKVLGVITVQSFQKNAYKDYHLQMLRSLAVYTAIAIDNANLYATLEQRVHERTEEIKVAYQNNKLLSEIGQQITASLNFEDIFDKLHKYVNQLMDAECFSVRIYHEDTQTIEYKYEFEKGIRDYEVLTLPLDPENNYSGWCIYHKKEIHINDHQKDYKKYVKNIKVVAGEMPESLVFLPIMMGDKVLGVITVQSFKKFAYTEYHIDILKNLASYTAIALTNASLYETMEEKVKERTAEVVKQKEEIEKTYENTRILSQIGKDISTTFSIQDIIDKVYTNLNTLMDASCFGIGVYREKSNEIVFPATIEKKKRLMPYSYSLKDVDRPAVWCYTNQKDYLINNFSEEFIKSKKVTDYQAKEGDNPESIIYVPITHNDKKIGVITVQSFRAHAYSDYQLQLLKSLSVYVAIAIDNASLYNNLEDRVRERTEEIEKNYNDTRLIGEISKEISSSLSVATIISSVYKNIHQLMKADSFGIGIFNEATHTIDFSNFMENRQAIPDFKIDVNDQNRLGAICFKNKQDIIINDFSTEYSKYIKLERKPISGNDNMSVIYLPLYSSGDVIGVISVQSLDKNAYSEYQVNILKNLSLSIGIAIENASLYQNLEEKVNERTREVVKQKEEIEKTYENTRLLSQIGNDITSTLSVEEIIDKVYANVNNLMDATGFGIGVFKKETHQIVYPVYIEGEEKFEDIVYEKDDVNRLTNVCFYQNREIVINDFLNDIKQYLSNYIPPLKGQPVESLIYLPLKLKDKKMGVITVQSFKKNRYNDYHVQMLKNLAVYVAIALDNAALYENLENMVQARTREVIKQKELLEKNFSDTKLIAQISKDITSSLSIETIIATVYENVNKLMSAESFGIGIHNPDTNSLQFPGFIERSQKMPYFEFKLEDKDRYAVLCFDKGQEIVMNDVEQEYTKYIKARVTPIAGSAPSSLIYSPLIVKDRKIGVITVQSFKKGAYSDYQVNLFRNLANSVAIAVDNASLYQNLEEKVKERTEEVFRQKSIIEAKNKDITDSIQYAKKIQLALMTETNLFQETFNDSFVLFKPKDIVSGDFYWATQKQLVNSKGEIERLVYLAVCDSTGHGVPGAFMSLLNISFLNEAINEKNISAPNEVFNYVRQKLINNISKEGQKDGFDGTLLCINTTTGEITYSAAYNPPILISGTRMNELVSDRMPVGYGERTQQFTLNTIRVKKGDVLYLTTDGYADQFGGPKGKKFMFKKLGELLLSISKLSLSEQSEILAKTFDDWKGNLEQIDDVCIIGLKF